MPEDLLALYSDPETIRRFAALHTKAATIFNALASAVAAADYDVANACVAELSNLSVLQERGSGVAPTASA